MPGLADEVRAIKRLPSPGMAREILRSADVGAARVAEELGVHPVTVSRWLAGTRCPRGDLRLRYAQLLDEIAKAVGE